MDKISISKMRVLVNEVDLSMSQETIDDINKVFDVIEAAKGFKKAYDRDIGHIKALAQANLFETLENFED